MVTGYQTVVADRWYVDKDSCLGMGTEAPLEARERNRVLVYGESCGKR